MRKQEAGMGSAAVPAARMDAGLALLRVLAGVVFAAHGAQKLFVFGLDGLIQGFSGMGVPFAVVVAPGVALLEFAGGIALAAGLWTRPVAAGLAGVMLAAIFLVHLPAGFFMPDGIEFVLTLFAAAGALALIGPGRYSADAVLLGRRAAV